MTDENSQVLNLMQAMIGAITPNFRRVTLELLSPRTVCLRFILERDDPDDREELDDIAFEFEALQTHGIELDVKVIVDARPIAELDLPGRVVFGRKE
ncbi:hypothetical protein [Cystobacter fuscus]|nr:hypothetical protein [Cystobacter fuscus]